MTGAGEEPEWMKILREECAAHGQPKTAKRMGYSVAVVNRVLHGKYQGNIDNVRKRVEGGLMGKKVHCPALGDEINRRACLDHQKTKASGASPIRQRLAKACPRCTQYRGGSNA